MGVERANDRAAELKKVETVLKGVPILEFDEAAAHLFGKLTAHLLRIGRPAGDMDVLIAAVTMAGGHSLVTRNPTHFADVPGLVVHSY